VKFEGKATVSWSETGFETTRHGSQRKKTRKNVYYRDIESYFPSGKSIYPFAFTIPFGIPSSYVGKAGQVYYCAEVLLRCGKSDRKQRFPFSVNGILDLNHEPGVTQALDVRKYKSICCFCCRSGPVGFLLKVHKKGYVPGEPIRFAVEMNNQSTRKITGITLSLVQVMVNALLKK
jgi:hypothetical protein